MIVISRRGGHASRGLARPAGARSGSLAALALAFGAIAASPSAQAQDPSFADRAAALYATRPDVAVCRAGALTEREKQAVVATLNQVRALHGLGPVVYDSANDGPAMQAALMMAANGRLDHHPTASWACHSAAGARVAGESNLHGGVVSPYLAFHDSATIIAGWVTDVGNGIADNIGHRRWLLDPFLDHVSFGRVAQALPDGRATDAAVIRVFGDNGDAEARTSAEFVAYPFADYPERFYADNAILSFSVVIDRLRKSANLEVDFSHATVALRRRGGGGMPVRNLRFDSEGYGLPNNLQFTTDPISRGTHYDVAIGNVIVAGAARNYEYSFRIVP